MTWYSPTAERPAAPTETGKRLATFSRGKDEEMRVSLDEFKGFAYVGLRVWARGPGDAWFPTKKGLSVKLREVPGLLEALATIEAPAEGAANRRPPGGRQTEATSTGPTDLDPDRPQFVDKRRRSDRRATPQTASQTPFDLDFDEMEQP